MLVKKYMTKDPIFVKPDENVTDAFHLLLENGIRQVPVVDKGELVGIVTDRDLRMAIVQNIKTNRLNVEFVMSKDPVTVTENTSVVDAGKLISAGKFNALPVIKKSGRLAGIITTTDILACFIDAIDGGTLPLITK